MTYPTEATATKPAARWRTLAVALVALLFAMPASAATPNLEYQVKAVFLFRFAQFVEWPSSAFPTPETPLVIGVLGDDPFGTALEDAVRDERVNDRPLVIERYRRIEEVGNCHVLFISRSEAPRLRSVLAELAGRNILTVSDVDDFTQQGGMVRFVIEAGKTRFRIALEAVKAANLNISSKLLRSATIVDASY